MRKNDQTSFFNQLVERLVKRSQRQRVMQLRAPEMLLIGCVDARLDPYKDIGIPERAALIYRNIAAQVYGHSDHPDEAHLGEEASLEYAIKVKGVKDIVVMGHTHCGGIGTCMCSHAELKEKNIPHLEAYLEPLQETKKRVQEQGGTPEQQKRAMEKAAVMQSIANLKTYPWLEKLVNLPESDPNKVHLHGWVIDTASKCIKEMDERGNFSPMKKRAGEGHSTFNDIRDLNEKRQHIYEERKRRGEAPAIPQHHPKALIIGGIDERVSAHLLGIRHGEALIYRNPTAYIAGTEDPKGNHNLSAAAVIEFATKVMGVEDIIVLGHRGSGGITSLLDEERAKANPQYKRTLPHTPSIISYLSSLFSGVKLPHHADDKTVAKLQRELEERSVNQSIANIKTYDGVQNLLDHKVAGKQLHIHGMIYNPLDQSVEIRDDKGEFQPLQQKDMGGIRL